MTEYIFDEQGKWLIQGSTRLLVEPSEQYLQKRQAEQQAREEQEKLDSLVPTEEDIRKAETELQIITILQEVGLV